LWSPLVTKWSPWIGGGGDNKINKLPEGAKVQDVHKNFKNNLDLFYWLQDLKQLDLTADQKFIEDFNDRSEKQDKANMSDCKSQSIKFKYDSDLNTINTESLFSDDNSIESPEALNISEGESASLNSINKKLMKKLWHNNGYGGGFDYLLEHHEKEVVDILKDDTILERTYNKRKINMVLPLETATMDPRYDVWDDAGDITSEDFEAMNVKYPKKPRREAYENEGTKSIFEPTYNNSYQIANMGHRQLETCYVAAQKPSLISKLASSFSSPGKMDPPETNEITTSMDDELEDILGGEAEEIKEEDEAKSLSDKHKEEFILMDEDTKFIYESKTLCNPKRVTLTQLLHDEDVDLDYITLIAPWPLQVEDLCSNKSDFNPQHAVSKSDRTGICEILPKINNRVRSIIRIRRNAEFPTILEKNLEEIDLTLDKCTNVSLMFTLYLFMKELALYRRLMMSEAEGKPELKNEWWYKSHMKEIRHLINNAYCLCCSDLPNFSVGSFNILDILTPMGVQLRLSQRNPAYHLHRPCR
jgi:hypothetical protein